MVGQSEYDAHPLGTRPFGRADYIRKFQTLTEELISREEGERFLAALPPYLFHTPPDVLQTNVRETKENIEAGVSKFVLRPVGSSGEEVLAQTRQLIEQVLPQVATRWRGKAKVGAE